ncbi:MAG TPA: hypothetical protein VLW85_15625 [Myxococcales bacterium]|nr:hypothetical protein [Myxococcales bacterium]
MLQKRWAPWIFAAVFVALLAGPALDPSAQLFYRDTGRCEYLFKQFIAQQLRAGQSPFWDPWTESGTSVLGQVTPGLFHPFTLLYLLLPFELAFKLNSLLCIPLALAGAYWLARRCGAADWPAMAAADAYAGCGYVVSMTSSNVHFAIGAATMPLAIAALLWFVERPRPGRLLCASACLALIVLGGEPQSALIAGVIGGMWALRRAPLAIAWGACAVLLAAPAWLPAMDRIAGSTRVQRTAQEERGSYRNAPARLLGLALPYAFDEASEAVSGGGQPTYAEYFARGGYDEAFADSIALGVPVLLLALFAFRRAPWLLIAAGLLLVFSVTGVPGLTLFHFSEKMTAPAALLVCVAAALSPSELRWKPAAAVGVALLAARLALLPLAPALTRFMQAHGRTHAAPPAQAFVAALGSALLVEGALCVALAAAARFHAAAVAAVCAAAALAQSGGLLFTIPLDVLHEPIPLAEELKARAGPSEGRWRIRAQTDQVLIPNRLDQRTARFVGAMQILNPMLHQLAGIESVSEYTSLADADYEAALLHATPALAQVMGVRFDVRPSFAMTAAQAARGDYAQVMRAWVKDLGPRPRAFLARCARVASDRQSALLLMQVPPFQPEEAVTFDDPRLPCPGVPAGTVALQRLEAPAMRAETDAPAPQLLIVAEHFDTGWRAWVDGMPAAVLRADLGALAVRVPEGRHAVEFRYRPPLLLPAALVALAAALALALLELLQRQHRVRPAEAE